MFVKTPVPKLLPCVGTTSANVEPEDDPAPLPSVDPTTTGWGPEPARTVSVALTPGERRLYVAEC